MQIIKKFTCRPQEKLPTRQGNCGVELEDLMEEIRRTKTTWDSGMHETL